MSMKNLLSKWWQPTLLGLDIGSSSIKAVQLKKTKEEFQLQHFGFAPLPPESIVNGGIFNSGNVINAIRGLCGLAKIQTKNVVLAINGHSLIIKKISVAEMTERELEEQLPWEAAHYIPDVSDVNMDYRILGHRPETNQMEILLVAAKMDMVNDYVAMVTEAGLDPVIVDVDALALENAFAMNYEVQEGNVVLINIGASTTNINILSGGKTAFVRVLSIGGNQFTEEIQKQFNISLDEAEALKLGGEMPENEHAILPQEVDKILCSVAGSLAAEIQKSIDFYSATTIDANIAKIYLSGGTSKIAQVKDVLENRLGLPFEIMDSFKKIQIDKKQFDVDFLKRISPMAAAAVGLASREL